MKKVLIILPSPLENLGGIEVYNKYLIEILKKNNFDIDLYILNPKKKNDLYENCSNVTFGESLDKFYFYFNNKNFLKATKLLFSIKRKFNTFLKDKNYQLIIDNTNIGFKKVFKNKNAIWVQHFSYNFLANRNSKGFKKLLIKIVNHIFQINISFKKMKNLIVFSNSEKLFKSKKNNIFIINPFSKFCDFNYKKEKNDDEIVFCGRINEHQKNISLLLDVDKELRRHNKKITFYGDGEKEKLLNADYRGRYNYDEISKIYEKAKLSICLSKYEGCPLFLVESLAFNTPIAVLDTFESASFLTNENRNGILLKNDDPSTICKEILNFINNFNYESKQIENFYYKNLSKEVFKTNWEKVISTTLN